MKYLGNQPGIELVQSYENGFDYLVAGAPSVSTNPDSLYATWLDITTGVVYVCIDNTPGANIWKAQGPITSEKASFTPVIGGWTSNVTWSGQRWRKGNLLYLQVHGDLTGAPSGNLSLTLPDSLAIDDAVLDTDVMQKLGEAVMRDTGTTTYVGPVMTQTDTTLRVYYYPATTDTISSISATHPFTWANTDKIDLNICVPIKTWNVNTIP